MIVNKRSLSKDIQNNPRNGQGKVYSYCYKNSKFFDDKINGFYLNELNKGSEIGIHKHEEEIEIYFILEGEGIYYDNDEWIEVKKNDLLICNKFEKHGLKAIEDLKFIAYIIKN